MTRSSARTWNVVRSNPDPQHVRVIQDFVFSFSIFKPRNKLVGRLSSVLLIEFQVFLLLLSYLGQSSIPLENSSAAAAS